MEIINWIIKINNTLYLCEVKHNNYNFLSKKILILAKLNRAQIIEIEIIVWNRKVTLYLMTIILTTLERWLLILLDRLHFLLLILLR